MAHGMFFLSPIASTSLQPQAYMEMILGNKNRYEMSIQLVPIGPNALD